MRLDRCTRSFVIGTVALAAFSAAACGKSADALKREYFDKGEAYMKEQKYAEAIIEYRNAAAQDDHFGAARYKLATAYVRSGNGTRALEEAVRAADLMPTDVDAQLQAA